MLYFQVMDSLAGTLKHLMLIAACLVLSAVLFGLIQLNLAPPQRLSTLSLPYHQGFEAELNLRRWFTGEGRWAQRSAALIQAAEAGEEAAQLHLPQRLPAAQPYHLSAEIALQEGAQAAGFVFNSQYLELTQNQHRIFVRRSAEGGWRLIAGYTTPEDGFATQADIPLPDLPGPFRLDVYVFETTYQVLIDDVLYIEQRPLFHHDGFAGFYAEGPAQFDTLTITAAAERRAAGLASYSSGFAQSGAPGWLPLSGQWSVTEGELAQADAAQPESLITYEVEPFQGYVLRVSLAHIEGSGAGLLFNLPSPRSLEGGHVVRFSSETDALIWGHYNAAGGFTRQGFAGVGAPGSAQRTLEVRISQAAYDVLLDGVLIAQDVPLQNTQGYIGLVTARSAASFRLVEAFPLFDQPLITPTPE